MLGAAIGGAAKNVVAIAAGIVSGLGFGDNARAALVTRGLAEIGRLATEAGAQQKTISGLAGLGDLILSCASIHSRRHIIGLLRAPKCHRAAQNKGAKYLPRY